MATRPVIDKNSRQYLMNLYNNARSNLLLVVVFSFINAVLLVANSSWYFLFSASFPYYVLSFGYAMSFRSGNPIFYYVAIGLAIITISLYLLCWFLSKKRRGAVLVATVLFGLDCLIMLGVFSWIGFDGSFIIDIVFHVWVMFSLIRGFSASNKLSRMPEEIPSAFPVNYENAPLNPAAPDILQDSIPLRPVDMDVNSRILIEGEYAGMSVQVRRTGHTTEFVVNNMVYAEQTALMEGTYSWDIQVCRVPFHYEASAAGQQILSSNGVEIARKTRLF